MANIFSKDENLMTSAPIIGYQLLNLMAKRKLEKISIFDIADQFKDEKWFSAKNLYFGMFFLFSTGLIEFNEAYIIKNV